MALLQVSVIDTVVDLIVDEGWWLAVSMVVAFAATATLLVRGRSSGVGTDRLVLAGMTLFAGCTIGMMAFGHLLAVSTKLVLGTLDGAAVLLYLIGAALAAPSWMLVAHTRSVLDPAVDHTRQTLLLNGWLVATLLALGLNNLPLALPAALNVGYQLNRNRGVGWAIVALAVLANLALFVGSLIFMASGQSFEEFSRMR